MRRIAQGLLVVLAALGAGLAAACLLLGNFDLAPLAARQLTRALGREVAVGGLHVTPGRWIKVGLAGVRVANIAGGARPAMVELGDLEAEIDALSLLRRPIVVRRLAIDGLSVLLERGPDRTGNWVFGRPEATASATKPAGRNWYPTLLDARVHHSEVIYRAPGGREFRTRLDNAVILAEAADQPVRLSVAGAYNGTAIELGGDLQPMVMLRDVTVPYGVDLRLAASNTVLTFKGTMTDPLNVDGAQGVLALNAPDPAGLFAVAGITSGLNVSLSLGGDFERAGDLWRLEGATGKLNGDQVTAATLRLMEGGRGKPDDISADIGFDRLDLNGLLGRPAKGAATRGGADIPLDIDRAPDTLVGLRLAARELRYGSFGFSNARFAAAQTPGRVAVQELALTYLGAQVRASGQVDASAEGAGRVSGRLNVSGADVQQLGRALGLRSLPLFGQLDARLVVESSGTTLNAATRLAHVSAAVAMTGGAIPQKLIELASTDVRLLFRKNTNMSPVSCLLGVLDMRAGVGSILPLRIRSAAGTIAGDLRFNLYQSTFDLIFASQRDTTSFFALDIPVRVSGSFVSPTVRPARLSKSGRALLAATDQVSRMPPELQALARANPCIKPR